MAAARSTAGDGPAEAAAVARRVEALIARHGPALLRTAHQFSLCRDDALDAYQRALEIYVRRVATVDVATEGAWMRVVVKHEAMAVRRARGESVDREERDLDSVAALDARGIDERVASEERVARSVEALRALKPDEAKALMLKAEGLSYDEIGRRFGWTYTKVNRSISEGRARFMKVFRGIESGEACDGYAEILAALAAGSATSAQLVEIRPHLRHCTACRATVRELHMAGRRKLVLLLPVPVTLHPLRLPRLPGLHLRTRVTHVFHRLSTTDLATGVQLAVPPGGGRIGTAAAVVAFCLSGLGAGAVCVVSGVLHVPTDLFDHRPAPSHVNQTARPHHRHHEHHPPPRLIESPTRARFAAAAPTPPPHPHRASPRPARATTPPARTAPPRPAPAPASPSSRSQAEFGFEPTSQTTSSPPPRASHPPTNQPAPKTPTEAAQQEFGP